MIFILKLKQITGVNTEAKSWNVLKTSAINSPWGALEMLSVKVEVSTVLNGISSWEEFNVLQCKKRHMGYLHFDKHTSNIFNPISQGKNTLNNDNML